MVEFQLLETMQELKEVEKKRAALKRIDNELECTMGNIISHSTYKDNSYFTMKDLQDTMLES